MAVENIPLMHFDTEIGTIAMDDDKVITIAMVQDDPLVTEVLDVLLSCLSDGSYVGLFLMPRFRPPTLPTLPGLANKAPSA